MTIELTMLLAVLGLAFTLALAPSFDKARRNTPKQLMGNRDDLAPPSSWGQRAQRTRDNLFENLPIFMGLVLIAEIAGKTNPMTALGAQIFFWARLAHAVFYLAGIWQFGARTIAWLISVAAMALIAAQLI